MEKTVTINDGDGDCGTVTVTLVPDSPTEEERKKGGAGSMVFEFKPKKREVEGKEKGVEGERKEPPKDCCGESGPGWIQHTRLGSTQDWSYDNATKGPPTAARAHGQGEASDPSLSPQPTKPGAKGYSAKPWYGGEYGKPEDEKFAKDPKPHATIGDLPGGPAEFRTQLVCVETGKVLLDWEWNVSQPQGTSKLERGFGRKLNG